MAIRSTVQYHAVTVSVNSLKSINTMNALVAQYGFQLIYRDLGLILPAVGMLLCVISAVAFRSRPLGMFELNCIVFGGPES